MKKLIAMVLVGLLLMSAAYAAEWTEGRSPEKPYLGKPAADFSKTIGYMMLYPKAGEAPQSYCDVLRVYLPREDVAAGQGKLKLFAAEDGKVLLEAAFNDETAVTQRAMTEEELDALLWGSGTVFEIFLPKSLEMGKSYYVNLEEGCVLAKMQDENWEMPNGALVDPTRWTFAVEGEYGVNNLYYAAPAEEDAEPELHVKPAVGDEVVFELVLAGDAKSAVIYTDNDSVRFDEEVFTESGVYRGEVVSEDLSWGIDFLSESGTSIAVIFPSH